MTDPDEQKKKAKHKKDRLPRWVRRNPGKGRHGVDDKGAAKVAKDWDKDNKR